MLVASNILKFNAWMGYCLSNVHPDIYKSINIKEVIIWLLLERKYEI